MGVEFYEDESDEHRWRVVDAEEDGPIHACHEGFSSKWGALQNLFLNHARMSNFVSGIAGNLEFNSRPEFFIGKDKKTWWRITASNNEIIGSSHKGFNSRVEAVDNLIMTYTMLAMFIAMYAQERNSE